MIFLTQKKSVEYSGVNTSFFKTEWDYSTAPGISTTVTEKFNIGVGTLVNDGIKPTIILMPAMRFNQQYGRAIQVALSGVIFQKSNGSFQGIPIPMVSWLRQF